MGKSYQGHVILSPGRTRPDFGQSKYGRALQVADFGQSKYGRALQARSEGSSVTYHEEINPTQEGYF